MKLITYNIKYLLNIYNNFIIIFNIISFINFYNYNNNYKYI